MTLVKKVQDTWQPLRGVQILTRMVATCTVQYHDGRSEELPCDPYPVEEHVDMSKLEYFIAEGIWGEAELGAYGLKVADTMVVPEGKMRVGEVSYAEHGDQVIETWELEDIPPPPPEPTPLERLAAFGLTPDDLRELLGGGGSQQ